MNQNTVQNICKEVIYEKNRSKLFVNEDTMTWTFFFPPISSGILILLVPCSFKHNEHVKLASPGAAHEKLNSNSEGNRRWERKEGWRWQTDWLAGWLHLN